MHESFPKGGPHGGKKFDTVSFPSGWPSDPHRTNYRKSGRHPKAAKAGDNYKVNPRQPVTPDSSRRTFPKKGNRVQNSFGTGKSL